MKRLKTGELAERLGVSSGTVRNYVAEFADYLSVESAGVNPNAKRQYSERDALVLATITDLRNQGLRSDQIKEALAAGRLVETLPEAPTPAEKEARENVALVVRPEYERVLDRLQVLQDERDRLIVERDRAIETWQSDVTALNAQISTLEHRIGQLEGQVGERLPMRTTLQIAAVLIIGLLVFLALAVVFLAGRGGG